MIHFGQISANMSSPAVQVAVVVAGCLVLYVAFKIGYVILKIVIGSGGALALLGGACWWLLSGMHH
jgi:hypothetical protein